MLHLLNLLGPSITLNWIHVLGFSDLNTRSFITWLAAPRFLELIWIHISIVLRGEDSHAPPLGIQAGHAVHESSDVIRLMWGERWRDRDRDHAARCPREFGSGSSFVIPSKTTTHVSPPGQEAERALRIKFIKLDTKNHSQTPPRFPTAALALLNHRVLSLLNQRSKEHADSMNLLNHESHESHASAEIPCLSRFFMTPMQPFITCPQVKYRPGPFQPTEWHTLEQAAPTGSTLGGEAHTAETCPPRSAVDKGVH